MRILIIATIAVMLIPTGLLVGSLVIASRYVWTGADEND